jgi:hypothetical protein
VLRTRQPRERRVTHAGSGTHHLMRMQPDKSGEQVLVSFVDITPIVAIEAHERELSDGSRTILEMALKMAETTARRASTPPLRGR